MVHAVEIIHVDERLPKSVLASVDKMLRHSNHLRTLDPVVDVSDQHHGDDENWRELDVPRKVHHQNADFLSCLKFFDRVVRRQQSAEHNKCIHVV